MARNAALRKTDVAMVNSARRLAWFWVTLSFGVTLSVTGNPFTLTLIAFGKVFEEAVKENSEPAAISAFSTGEKLVNSGLIQDFELLLLP